MSQALLPYSEDQKHRVPGQDDGDNFEISGPVTPHKHVQLRFYEAMLGGDIERYLLIGGQRHPLDRMLSLYFYPGNWVRDRVPGGKRLSKSALHVLTPLLVRREEPYWDEERFLRLIASKPPMSDFYRTGSGQVRVPDVALTSSSLAAAARTIGTHIGVADLEFPHLNRSLRPDEVTRLSRSRELADAVYRAHAEDYSVFGYDLLPPA